MPTSYTSNYQIKRIGTGEEASTWGISTNTTWAKLEEMIGGGVEVEVSSPGPASSYEPTNNTLKWITTNTATAGQPNSQGRAAFVTFVDGTGSFDLGTAGVVEIWGDTASLKVKRVFFVKNELTASRDIVLKCGGGGTDYTLANGAFTAVYVDGATSVVGVLENLQVSKLDFRSSGSGIVELAGDTGNAFNLIEGTNRYLSANTQTAVKSVLVGNAESGSDCKLLDVRTTEGINLNYTDQADIFIEDGKPASLRFRSYAGTDDYITLNTSSKSIVLGDVGVNRLDIDTSAITTSTQATTWELKPDSVALNFRDGGASFLKLDTTPATNKVTITGDCAITGTLDITGDVMGSTTYDGTVIINSATAIDVSTQNSDIVMKRSDNNALTFINAVDGFEWLRFDTSEPAGVIVGQTASGGPDILDIRTGTVSVAAVGTEFLIRDTFDNSLDFKEGSNSYLNFRTNPPERVEFGKPISGASGGTLTVADDLIVSGAGAGNNAIAVVADPGHIQIQNGSQFKTVTDGGVSVPLIVMGASDQIAIGAETSVTSVELRCSTDDFLVQYNAGNKAIWHDDSPALSTVDVNVSWELAVSSATALQIKDGAGGASMMTFDTDAPDIDIHVPLSITGNSTVNGALTVGGSAVSGAEGGEIHLTSAPDASGFTGTVALDTRAKQVRIFGSGTPLDAGAEFLFKTADGDAVITGDALTLWGSGNDGPGSGLNADMLDGAHLADIMTSVLGSDSTGAPYQNNIGRLLLDDGTLLVQWGWTTEIVSNSLTVPVTASYTYPVAFGATPYLMVVPYTWYSVPFAFPRTRTYAAYSTLDPEDNSGHGTYSSTDTVLTWRVKRLSQSPSAFDITWDSCPFIAIGAPA